MDLGQHPDEDVSAASRDPNAGGVDLQDELGSERPGIIHETAMRFIGLAAAREIVRLRAERDRAERLLQEQATEVRILREQVRQAAEQTK